MDKDIELLDEIVDIEAYARDARRIPNAKHYKIRINKTTRVVDRPTLTGREILALVGFTPAEQYLLRQKGPHGAIKKIEPNDVVDFRAPGVERFVAQKREVQDGA